MKQSTQGDTPSISPVLVFTDGCKIPKLDTGEFEAYLTFPLPPLERLPKQGEKVEALMAAFGDGDTETYQIYGFDSLYLIAEALGQVDAAKEPVVETGRQTTVISRLSLVASLSSGRKFDGVLQSYSFRNNEVENFKFYILKIINEKGSEKSKYVFHASVGRGDLSELPSEKNPEARD